MLSPMMKVSKKLIFKHQLSLRLLKYSRDKKIDQGTYFG